MQSGSFPNNWKKLNIVSVYKKDEKQLLQNYQPVSLLPICGENLRNYFQTSCSWLSVLTGVSEFIFGTIIFLIYIYDLPGNLQSTGKLFADDKLSFLIRV